MNASREPRKSSPVNGRTVNRLLPAPVYLSPDEAANVEHGHKAQLTQNRKVAGSRFTPTQGRIARKALAAAVREEKPDVSRERVSQVVEKVREKAVEAMDACGLGDRELIERYLRPALEANETRFFPMATEDDETNIEERTTIAWTPRLRALDMAYQLRGSYAPKAASLEVGVELTLADAMRKARARVVIRQNDGNNEGDGQGTSQDNTG